MTKGTATAITSYTFAVKKSVLGAKVVNVEREELGTIEDLIVDSRDNTIVYAILSSGGLLGIGDKHFAIPWQALALDMSEQKAVLNINKDRLTNAPGFDKDNWPDMSDSKWHSEIHKHFGV